MDAATFLGFLLCYAALGGLYVLAFRMSKNRTIGLGWGSIVTLILTPLFSLLFMVFFPKCKGELTNKRHLVKTAFIVGIIVTLLYTISMLIHRNYLGGIPLVIANLIWTVTLYKELVKSNNNEKL